MQPGPASQFVRAARANVRLASQTCAAADLSSVQRALDLLEAAASEMRRAEEVVRAGALTDPDEVRGETRLLKREVAGTMRVIDGCAALRRSLSLRLGCSAPSYGPQGRAIAASPAAACEVQG